MPDSHKAETDPPAPGHSHSPEGTVTHDEQPYREMLQKHPDILALIVEGKLTYTSPALERLVGYTSEEALGRSPLEFMAPEDHARARERMGDLLAGAPPEAGEYGLVHKDGRVIPVEIRSLQISHQGTPTLLAVMQDITDRKRTMDLLKARESRLRLLTEQVPAVLWTTDLELRFTSSTGRGLELLDLKPDQVVGMSLTEYFGTDDPGYAPLAAHRRALIGEPATFEQEWGDRTYNTYIEPLRDDVGNITGTIGIALDITARKNAEQALLESELAFRQMAENINEVFWLTDWTKRKVLYISPAYETIYGQPCRRLYEEPRSWAYPIHPEDRQRVEKAFDEKVELGLYDEVYRVVHADGSIRWIRDRGFPIHNSAGQLYRMAGISEDITERKLAEEQLSRARRLEAAGQLAGQIAHDFNNLLGTLVIYPDLIRSRLGSSLESLDSVNDPSGETVSSMLAMMKDAATQIADINQQLLTLGRRGHYKVEAVDLNDAIAQALRSVEIPERIAIHRDLEDGLPSIRGGRSQLARAVSNLVLNAIEAMPEEGSLTVRTQRMDIASAGRQGGRIPAGEYAELSIADTGHGIAPEILDNVFDPYFTTKKTDRRRGSGLGLSVVRSVIEDHKGHIAVETAEGQGTTFRILFPASPPDQSTPEPHADLRRGNGERVLVVDDDPMQLKIAGQALTELGYTVHTVSSGREAVAYIAEHPQDVVVLDMVMDGMDGVETLDRITRINPKQRAILLSAYAPSDQVGVARSLGAETFLAKPVDLATLAEALWRVLEKKGVEEGGRANSTQGQDCS